MQFKTSLFLVALSFAFLAEAPASSLPGKNLAANSGFESVSVSPDPTGRKWKLKSDDLVPDRWNLSPAFPGELEVVESDAPEGERFLRITAAPNRATHLYQGCPEIVRGSVYEISLRHRRGPVALEMYEYNEAGDLVAEHVFAKSATDADLDGEWQETTGYYMLPAGVVRTSLAIVVEGGGRADLDDLRFHGFERSFEKLNVRDYGVSGSSFETTAKTREGSADITVKAVGDFKVGDEIRVSNCKPHFTNGLVWDETGMGTREGNFKEQVRLRGYDGSRGERASYILDFSGESPASFRWSDDLGQSWKERIEVTGDWQQLNGGIEVKLPDLKFWTRPRLVSFIACNYLLSEISGIEDKTLTLAHSASLTAEECLVHHSDSGPLQRAFDRAVGEQRNVFIPSGHYRLSRGLFLKRPNGISIEGENEENTVLDLSNGEGACITVEGGKSVSFRRLRFRGFSSFAEMKRMAYLPAEGYPHMWGFFAEHCNAITLRSPERVLVENCHATGMSAECFYSGSVSRKGGQPVPAQYPKAITYRQCTVSDCARNAFNNNDFAENTSVLDCRIENIGGCAWEGASRFVRFTGNYLTNSGPVAMGNIRSREKHFDILPSGQHIVSNNTFEGTLAYGNTFVAATAGATPVIISNNVFVNLNASAIEVSGHGNERNLPAGNVIITGNAIDLTCVSGESGSRFGIKAFTNDTTISDNQIYTRQGVDPKVTGVIIAEPARNIIIHDNLIRNCGVGLEANRIRGSVGEIIDARRFKSNGRMPWPRRDRFRYRNHQMMWMPDRGEPNKLVEGPFIEAFDPDEGVFQLREETELKPNAVFVLRAPDGFSWSIHHNTISDCARLVRLDVFGGAMSVFSDNLLKWGEGAAFGGKDAVEIFGQFEHSNNLTSGLEKDQEPLREKWEKLNLHRNENDQNDHRLH